MSIEKFIFISILSVFFWQNQALCCNASKPEISNPGNSCPCTNISPYSCSDCTLSCQNVGELLFEEGNCNSLSYNYLNAEAYCANLGDGWRLPNAWELYQYTVQHPFSQEWEGPSWTSTQADAQDYFCISPTNPIYGCMTQWCNVGLAIYVRCVKTPTSRIKIKININ
ncbi:MAG: hypothetical protein I8H75_01735 [Myxococcaceae bacterium]|nr:hypothetical protein [Myxococcaceae bacterium]MBH2006061.1 hypothetical protein [Myxococcaceae bacterium]